MKKKIFVVPVLLVVFGLFVATGVLAQDNALDFAITATTTLAQSPQSFDIRRYDTWIGGIVHITRSIVLRPSFLFVHRKEDSHGPTSSDYKGGGTAWGVSGSLCYYLRPAG